MKYASTPNCSFNPVWRDFCFSTYANKAEVDWASYVSIPSGGIFVFLPGATAVEAVLPLNRFNPVWRDFCFSTGTS